MQEIKRWRTQPDGRWSDDDGADDGDEVWRIAVLEVAATFASLTRERRVGDRRVHTRHTRTTVADPHLAHKASQSTSLVDVAKSSLTAHVAGDVFEFSRLLDQIVAVGADAVNRRLDSTDGRRNLAILAYRR